MKGPIRIITTGGTIDKVIDTSDTARNLVGPPQVERILARSNIRVDYTIESICRKDSLELTDVDRAQLFERVQAAKESLIIITHGTDTATESAKQLLGIEGKTIVFVGAMYPASVVDSDAMFNIGGALVAVQVLPAGVYLVANGTVYNPLEVRKQVDTLDYKPIR